MTDKIFITKEGLEEAEAKLKYLKLTRRAEATERIKIARDFGDISENAEYDAAKNEQAMIESEILELENTIKNAMIIEANCIKETVNLGCKVKVRYDDKSETVYEIVGSPEVNVKKGRISNQSPLGQGLLGKKKDDTVEISAPQGKIKLTIVDIE